MASENIIELTDANFEEEVIKDSGAVLVDFWAPWCGPCRMVGPIVEEIAGEYAGKIKVGKLNTDEAPQTAANFGIRSIPTLIQGASEKFNLSPKDEEFVRAFYAEEQEY